MAPVVDISNDALHLEFVPGPPDAAILACEQHVQGLWYGDTPEDIEQAYGPWGDDTVWLAVRAMTGDVVAAARLIAPGAIPQRTLSEASHEPWRLDSWALADDLGIDPTRAWDVATINVRRELGSAGSHAAEALYHGLFTVPAVNGGSSVLAMLDVRVRRLLATLGFVMHPLPGAAPEPYMGSPALQPVFARLSDLAEGQRSNNPDDHERVLLGQGLQHVALPPLEAFRIEARSVVDLVETHELREGTRFGR